MDRSNICNLISYTYSTDSIGQKIPTESTKQVYCSVESVTRAEWAAAGERGLKPEFRLTMFAYDYEGEDLVELDGERYGVYRTYHTKDDQIELYVERKAGPAGTLPPEPDPEPDPEPTPDPEDGEDDGD